MVDVVTGPRTHVTLYPTHLTFTQPYINTHTHMLYMQPPNVQLVPLLAHCDGQLPSLPVVHRVEILLGDILVAKRGQVPLERKMKGRKEGRRSNGDANTVQREGEQSERET